MADGVVRISRQSWHYAFAYYLYKETLEVECRGSICRYRLVIVPTSVLFVTACVVTTALLWLILGFFGFRVKWEVNPGSRGDDLTYPYKERRDGTRVRFAPWELCFPFLLVGMVGFIVQRPEILSRMAWGMKLYAIEQAIMAALVLNILLLVLTWKWVITPLWRCMAWLLSNLRSLFRRLLSAWSTRCPRIEFEG